MVAGVSGGADSIAMLDLLVKSGLTVCVAHLNHQLRPSASHEAEFVKKIAEGYGIDFITQSIAVNDRAAAERESVEEAARNARYQFLFKTAEKIGAAAVVVAHQADDQVETVLMNFLRGTGLNGLTGMQPCSLSAYHAAIPLVRPLLGCWREEIEDYCQSKNLLFVTDESNADTAYRRNRIRLELIPVLQTYNPRIKESLLQMAGLLSADKAFLDNYIQEVYQNTCIKTAPGLTAIHIDAFKNYPIAIQRALVKYILYETFPEQDELGAIHYEDVRRFLAREIVSTNLQVNDQIVLRVENGQGVLLMGNQIGKPSTQWPAIEQPFHTQSIEGEHKLGRGWKLIGERKSVESVGQNYRKNTDLFRAYLDAEKLGATLEVRRWQSGDRFKPLGMQGKRIKLSDFWINQKIPRRAKEFWPLLYSAGELIWIPGFQISDVAKVTNETREIIVLSVLKEN